MNKVLHGERRKKILFSFYVFFKTMVLNIRFTKDEIFFLVGFQSTLKYFVNKLWSFGPASAGISSQVSISSLYDLNY